MKAYLTKNHFLQVFHFEALFSYPVYTLMLPELTNKNKINFFFIQEHKQYTHHPRMCGTLDFQWSTTYYLDYRSYL
jgi:hypothetical protein